MKTQQQRILERLKTGKLNSYEATYEMRIKQAPTRIKELREQGYMIVSTPQKDRSVDWSLERYVVVGLHPTGLTVSDPGNRPKDTIEIRFPEKSYRMEFDTVNNVARKVYL